LTNRPFSATAIQCYCCFCCSLLLCLSSLRPPPISPLFPYTTLFRSPANASASSSRAGMSAPTASPSSSAPEPKPGSGADELGEADRKSTRLNSSHDQISYAVFCLKKKNKLIMQSLVGSSDDVVAFSS